MKVYFNSTLRGIKKFKENYQKIYQTIEKLGHKNIEDILFKVNHVRFLQGDYKNKVNLYKIINKDIQAADVIIIETTVQSLSMGYTLDKALGKGKPVILLYLEGYTPPLFAEDIKDEKLQVLPYNPETIEETLKYALDIAKGQKGKRFTIILPPEITDYLNKVAKRKKIPRSIFIRNLIEKEMRKDKIYNEAA